MHDDHVLDDHLQSGRLFNFVYRFMISWIYIITDFFIHRTPIKPISMET